MRLASRFEVGVGIVFFRVVVVIAAVRAAEGNSALFYYLRGILGCVIARNLVHSQYVKDQRANGTQVTLIIYILELLIISGCKP